MRIDADELEHAIGELLPAIVLGREVAHADRLAFVDAAASPLADRQRELQPAQLVDQAGLLGVDTAEKRTAARGGVDLGGVELSGPRPTSGAWKSA